MDMWAHPEGYNNVTPYLLVDDAETQVAFIRDALGGVEVELIRDPEGALRHAELRLGNSIVMLGQSAESWPAMPAMLYVYLGDADAGYNKAIAAGATSLQEPRDEYYGDRTAAVLDRNGNHWYFATRQRDLGSEEIQRLSEETPRG